MQLITSDIGIDRMLLKGFKVEQIDIEKLKEKEFIVIQDTDNALRLFKDANTDKEVGVNYIKISKETDENLYINELVIGRLEIDANVLNKVDYERIDLTIPNILSDTKTNEKNANTTNEIERALKIVENELKGLGFGNVNLIDAEIKRLEMNANISLNKPFKDYERVLGYLQGLAPKRLKKGVNQTHRPSNTYTGFKVGNKSMCLKMYDKRENIKKKHNKDIGQELLRIEYVLESERKIKEVLKSNILSEIIENNLESVKRAFKELLNKDIASKLYESIKSQERQAIRYLKENKGSGKTSAVDRYLKDYQTQILDAEILLYAIKKTSGSNYMRDSRKAIKSVKKVTGTQMIGNINKLNEILNKLGYESIEIDISNKLKKELIEL